MNVELGNKQIEEKLERILEVIPREIVKDLLSVYYSRSAQVMINDKDYANLITLEWITSLYELIDNLG